MELEKVDEFIIETYGDLEEHQKEIEEKIRELEPEYYTVDTDLMCTMWISTIEIMEKKET